MPTWSATAPSNIALIKYMGKIDSARNIPANPSLSYTLDNLISQVDIKTQVDGPDTWQPLQNTKLSEPLQLSIKAQQRFLQHLQFLKQQFNCNKNFTVQSNNNFPQSCGIASSAASFAALTKCALEAICATTDNQIPPIKLQAQLSRHGSGSSCRSFFTPWAIWEHDQVQAVDLPYKKLEHQIVIIDKLPKKVSSSTAHQLVTQSPDYINRPQRAEHNLQALTSALQQQNWQDCYQICWEEFQDMHNLFATCGTSFSYMRPETLQILSNIKNFWNSNNTGPIVTMDAGPNIHLLYQADSSALQQAIWQECIDGYANVY